MCEFDTLIRKEFRVSKQCLQIAQAVLFTIIKVTLLNTLHIQTMEVTQTRQKLSII